MNTMDKRREKLIARLKDKEHRDAFVSAHIQVGIPFQIRALREQRGWSQKDLANQAGVSQVWISRIENPNYSGFSLKTLLKLASSFEIGLIIRFVPISNLVNWELALSHEKLGAVSFEEDPYFKPPVTNIVGSGGVEVAGEGIFKNAYPPEQPQTIQPPQAKPRDELAKYREAKQEKLKSQLPKLMGTEKKYEIAFG